MSHAARQNKVPKTAAAARRQDLVSRLPAQRPGLAEAPARFQDLLVERGQLSPDELFRAIALQHRENLTLGAILQGRGVVGEETVLQAQAAAEGLAYVDLSGCEPTQEALAMVDPVEAIRLPFLPLTYDGTRLSVAVADPAAVVEVQRALEHLPCLLDFALAPAGLIRDALATHCHDALSAAANSRPIAAESCRSWAGRKPPLIGLALLALLVLGGVLAPAQMILGVTIWVGVALLLNGVFKVSMLWAALREQPATPPEARPERLPRISILVPLLRETDIADRLIRRMSRLDYPHELLEICLVYEEDDAATRAHLAGRALPYWMRLIEVPRDTLQTKPRAMNYALDFCKGEVIGIYDAEDAPEPDQIWRVVRRLAAAGDEVACVQCPLDYYNSRTNWISRCFTVEYAILFRVILPGLERLRLPLPLGGTSVFFKRDVLERLGRWDAQNVTEDADLGMRLHRHGYRCVLANSTTYEEANFRVVPWMKQRSRWLKGFLQTWMTHMRNPLRLWRDIGGAGFVVVQALFLGTVTSFLMAPVVLPMWLMTLGVTLPVYDMVPRPLLWALIGGFVATEAFLVALGILALRRRPGGGPARWTAMMPLYWPLGAFAAVKALWELFARPSWWDKTAHGINDAACQPEIDRLTGLPSTVNRASPGSETRTGG